MKHVIVSPHLDDSIFSLGSYIDYLVKNGEEVVILSPFGKVPEDDEGKKKYVTLLKEHGFACRLLGVKYINGQFLDDVYGPQDEKHLTNWFKVMIKKLEPDYLYSPAGIHHPDHILVRNILQANFKYNFIYMELPYAQLYPEMATFLNETWQRNKYTGLTIDHREIKEKAVACYKSQIQSPEILGQLYVEEKLWEV